MNEFKLFNANGQHDMCNNNTISHANENVVVRLPQPPTYSSRASIRPSDWCRASQAIRPFDVLSQSARMAIEYFRCRWFTSGTCKREPDKWVSEKGRKANETNETISDVVVIVHKVEHNAHNSAEDSHECSKLLAIRRSKWQIGFWRDHSRFCARPGRQAQSNRVGSAIRLDSTFWRRSMPMVRSHGAQLSRLYPNKNACTLCPASGFLFAPITRRLYAHSKRCHQWHSAPPTIRLVHVQVLRYNSHG